jgi:hypothetical protein
MGSRSQCPCSARAGGSARASKRGRGIPPGVEGRGEAGSCEEVKDVRATIRSFRKSSPSTARSRRAGTATSPGSIFLAVPKVGDVYVEEASLANAEDVTEVLSTTYAFGNGAPELDQLVPPALAATFCAAADCVVTKNVSLLEPGVFARKYYARRVGVFLEVEPDENKAIRLTSCSFDPRCASLAP